MLTTERGHGIVALISEIDRMPGQTGIDDAEELPICPNNGCGAFC